MSATKDQFDYLSIASQRDPDDEDDEDEDDEDEDEESGWL